MKSGDRSEAVNPTAVISGFRRLGVAFCSLRLTRRPGSPLWERSYPAPPLLRALSGAARPGAKSSPHVALHSAPGSGHTEASSPTRVPDPVGLTSLQTHRPPRCSSNAWGQPTSRPWLQLFLFLECSFHRYRCDSKFSFCLRLTHFVLKEAYTEPRILTCAARIPAL